MISCDELPGKARGMEENQVPQLTCPSLIDHFQGVEKRGGKRFIQCPGVNASIPKYGNPPTEYGNPPTEYGNPPTDSELQNTFPFLPAFHASLLLLNAVKRRDQMTIAGHFLVFDNSLRERHKRSPDLSPSGPEGKEGHRPRKKGFQISPPALA
ncbi:hypothetical protein AVEN_51455-1 [Araneus ventricosus]|uniref:Uncharacterized protein n=1 Tax=Araneus ventricosus TaxID=182803 RepID=A0A4Y2KEW6_ARAVE|nr:hypothetical protein AVEN_51455-1 [Araneus ventricosus]